MPSSRAARWRSPPAPRSADVKTRDKTQFKFEGMLGRMFGMFGGKAARRASSRPTRSRATARPTLDDIDGRIVDLDEEKVYELDLKKKKYKVTTFEELRRRMREAQEKAAKEAAKEDRREKSNQDKPAQGVRGRFRREGDRPEEAIAGYDTPSEVDR